MKWWVVVQASTINIVLTYSPTHYIFRTLPFSKKDDKKIDKSSEKDGKDLSKKPDIKSEKVEVASSNVVQDSLKKDEKKHIRRFWVFICLWCGMSEDRPQESVQLIFIHVFVYIGSKSPGKIMPFAHNKGPPYNKMRPPFRRGRYPEKVNFNSCWHSSGVCLTTIHSIHQLIRHVY